MLFLGRGGLLYSISKSGERRWGQRWLECFSQIAFPHVAFLLSIHNDGYNKYDKKIDLRRTNACSFLPSQRRRRNQAKQFFLILQVTSTFFASVKTFLLTNILCCKSYYGPRALLPSHFHVLRGTLGPRWEKASCDLFIDVHTEIGTLDIQSPLSPCATSHFLSNGQREHSYCLTTCDICRRSILEEQQYVLHLLTK